MGTPKQLLPVGGSSLLATAIARAAPYCARCIVVTGAERERVRRIIPAEAGVVEVYNPDYADGMITSIMAGARRVNTAWFFVAPADMPQLPVEAFARLAAAVAGDPDLPESKDLPLAYFPVARGRRGHPVLISSRVIPELIACGRSYPSMGAFLRRYPVAEVEVDDEGIFIDVDTPADLAAIRSLQVDGSDP
jgi:molybdenum cofactor cytidylyltransferase